MILLASIFAVLTAAFAAKAAMLTEQLRVARLMLAASERRFAPPPPPPPAAAARQFECRLESRGLLWFPVLTARDDDKIVVGVSSGLPHCVRCVSALKLVSSGRNEEWVCMGCGVKHPAGEADLMTTDQVLRGCLHEFFARHPDYSAAPGLSAPNLETASA